MEALLLFVFIFGLIWLFSSLIGDDKNSNTNKTKENDEYEQLIKQVTQRQRDADARAEQRRREVAWEEQQKRTIAETQRLSQAVLAEQQRQAAERAEQRRQTEARAEQQRHAAEREEQRRQAASREEQRRQAAARIELELCERDTDYAYAIDGIFNTNQYGFSLTTIRSLSSNTGVWEELENGVAQLDTEAKLSQYTFSYGNMHRGKLNQAFESLVANADFDLNGQSIEIIDYGCGQGIGSVGFIDFLKSYPAFNFSVQRVRLIEPSILALKRAALHVRYSLRSANQQQIVHAINKELDDVTLDDLTSDDDTVKIHIFSNILDVTEFNLQNLCDKIAGTFEGENYFICVSPNIFTDGSHPRNQRLVRFMNYFVDQYDTTVISQRTSNIGSWTRFERVFKVDFDEVVNTNNTNTVLAFDEPDDLPF